MPTYKLTYFSVSGVGDSIRLLLSYGGEAFEDKRLEYGGEEWAKMKPNTPFGQVPLLEINGGAPLYQHLAICRYLARKYGLAGDNDLEALEIDSIVETISDFKTKIYSAVGSPSFDEVEKTTAPYYLERLNNLAKSGYLANGKLSWADIYYLALVKIISKAASLDKYPNLRKVEKNLLELPKIKTFMDNRPVTEY